MTPAKRDAPPGRPSKLTLFFVALAALSAAALWWQQGVDATLAAVRDAMVLLAMIAPVIAAALLIGGYVQAVLPREAVSRWLGSDSGAGGYLLAMIAGCFTPAGPFAAFPLVLALRRGGAPFDVCVVYLSAWSTLGVQRIVIWELPFLGHEFVALRVLASLPVPLLAGLLARYLLAHRI